MRKLLMLIAICILMAKPVQALDLQAPTVPDYAQENMVSEPENLQEGILELLRRALTKIRPDIKEASRICLGIVASVLVVSLAKTAADGIDDPANLAGVISIAGIFFSGAGALIDLGTETVTQISEYGKLLLPVLTAALSAQGGISTSAALYAGTALFDAVLCAVISNVLIPLLYVFLALAVACSAIDEPLLKNLRNCVKWLMTWLLKTVLYVFTGFISLTGVLSGPTDALALKAAKLTISGVVPIVGGIMSDASEAVLVSAATVKNSIGLYGMFAVLAIWMDPFLKIGTHYLMLKFTGGVSGIAGNEKLSGMINDFATAMGFLVAMTGAVCLMLTVSTVCYMRGVG